MEMLVMNEWLIGLIIIEIVSKSDQADQVESWDQGTVLISHFKFRGVRYFQEIIIDFIAHSLFWLNL